MASNILGLSAFYHDSAAALIVDGVIVVVNQRKFPWLQQGKLLGIGARYKRHQPEPTSLYQIIETYYHKIKSAQKIRTRLCTDT